MSPTFDHAPAVELPDVEAGRLPQRYSYTMQSVFMAQLQPLLKPEVTILDVGSGRAPTLAPADRPEGCHYIGTDIAAEELAAAPPDAYDESFAHDISRPLPARDGVDIVISWQVLEHVASLPDALANLHAVIRPGGTMLAQFSGAFASFAIAARAMPHPVRVAVMARLLGHHEEEKFPTHFDRCYAPALRRLLRDWSSFELTSFYRGAPYLGFNRPLQRAYLAYEDLIASRQVETLATHYLLRATT